MYYFLDLDFLIILILFKIEIEAFFIFAIEFGFDILNKFY